MALSRLCVCASARARARAFVRVRVRVCVCACGAFVCVRAACAVERHLFQHGLRILALIGDLTREKKKKGQGTKGMSRDMAGMRQGTRPAGTRQAGNETGRGRDWQGTRLKGDETGRGRDWQGTRLAGDEGTSRDVAGDMAGMRKRRGSGEEYPGARGIPLSLSLAREFLSL